MFIAIKLPTTTTWDPFDPVSGCRVAFYISSTLILHSDHSEHTGKNTYINLLYMLKQITYNFWVGCSFGFKTPTSLTSYVFLVCADTILSPLETTPSNSAMLAITPLYWSKVESNTNALNGFSRHTFGLL